MPSVTIFLPWPTLSVAPWQPTLVLTPVLLRLTLTPGRTLIDLRNRKYPMVLHLSSVAPGARSRHLGYQTVAPLLATRRYVSSATLQVSPAASDLQVEQVSEPSDLVLRLTHY